MPREFTLLSGMMQASSCLVVTDRTSTLVENFGTSTTVDDDGESFITPPDSTSKEDTVQVDENSIDLYTIIQALGTNLYILMYIFFLFSSVSPSSLPITCSHDMQLLFKPCYYGLKLSMLS